MLLEICIQMISKLVNLNTGCGYIKEGKYPLEKQIEIIEKETKEFGKTREKYLLY